MFRFSDIRDGRLFVTQEKTGHKLALPLDLRLDSADLLLQDVIDRCRKNNPSDFMLYSAVRRGGRKPGPLTPDGITCAFSDIRDSTELKFGPNPPPFHEIRSLASRLYERERGEDFAQRLLGHKNLTMTKKYGRTRCRICYGLDRIWKFRVIFVGFREGTEKHNENKHIKRDRIRFLYSVQ